MTAPLPKARLDEIEARANAATPGPWKYGVNKYKENSWSVKTDGPLSSKRVIYYVNDPEDDQEHVDATFLAAARSDVPALVAEIRRLDDLLAGWADLHRAANTADAASELETMRNLSDEERDERYKAWEAARDALEGHIANVFAEAVRRAKERQP